MTSTPQITPTVSSGIPYRPLPPIRTVPDPPPRQPAPKPIEGDLDTLTPAQLENWRKVIAIQCGPLVARFLTDEDILWYRNALQAAVKKP